MLLSKMLLPGSNRRIHALDRHAGVAVAGMAADGRQVLRLYFERIFFSFWLHNP